MAARSLASGTQPAPSFERIYEEWFHPTCRWLRAIGVPERELEDVAQEAFLVVRRKLARFDGENLPGWLYRIAWRTASDRRRRAWFRHVVLRRPEPDDEPHAEGTGAVQLDPAAQLDRREAQRLVWRVLGDLGVRHRTALALFEIEGYSLAEIAELERIPVATVKTRLHYARRAFRERMDAIEVEARGRGKKP